MAFLKQTASYVVLCAFALASGIYAGDTGGPSSPISSPVLQPVGGTWISTAQSLVGLGDTVAISGGAFAPGETVALRVYRPDGTQAGSWLTTANSQGSVSTQWTLPYTEVAGDTLRLLASSSVSEMPATSTFLTGTGTDLDQLQNGTTSAPSQWANGNINPNNSCYSEGNSVPFRYFVTGTTTSSKHYFTVSMEWTKGGIHAYDYLTQWNQTEGPEIIAAGGACGVPTTPPPGCAPPSGFFSWPDPSDSNNYSGTIPPDFFTKVDSDFVIDGPGSLGFYNATIDSVSKYYFTGSASDRTWNVKVYFRTTVGGSGTSVGFFWGGHLASGTPSTWGVGNGSASVGGAPYHMRAKDFDGGGGANQDRSIQNGSVCLPPDATITCTPLDSMCSGGSYSCSVLSGAGSYSWNVKNGTITSGQGTRNVTFTVNAAPGGTVTISMNACNASSSCQGSFCCSEDTVVVPVKNCNTCPVATCHADTSIFLCSSQPVCISGFSCFDADGNLVSCTAVGGTLSGNTICFTPDTSGTYKLKLIALDSYGCADTCITHVTVKINQPPEALCHGDTTLYLCNLNQVCLAGFSGKDNDNNLKSVTVTGGTLSGNTVCFTPVAGQNTIRLISEDSCGAKDTCFTNVTVVLNRPPVVTCHSDTTIFRCSAAPVCLDGYSATDPDGNLKTVVVTGGTLSGNQVCFTPVVGTNTITLTATDSCGAQVSCMTTVTVVENQPPSVTCHNDTTIFVCDLSEICLSGYSAFDPDGNLTSVVAGGGTLNGNSICFTPVPGLNTLTLTATDACGAQASCQTKVTIVLNSPPSVTCHNDTTIFVCDLAEICLSGYTASDPDGNLTSVVAGGGTLNGNTICFTPVAGLNTLTLTATDGCGEQASCQTKVTVVLNSPPSVTCHNDTTIFVCDLAEICLPGYTASDPDGNLTSVVAGGGTLNGNTICFTPVAGLNTLTLTATDACGEQASCQTQVTVVLNRPPVVGCHIDTAMFVCNLGQICLTGFTATDPDGNLTSVTATGGTLNGNTVCFTPVVGLNTITLTATDACGQQVTCQTKVTVTLNSPPVVGCHSDTSMFVCSLSQICLDDFTATDPNNNLKTVTVTGGILTGNTVCFTPVAGVNTIRVIAEDSCGAKDTCETKVTVTLNQPPTLTFNAARDTSLCSSVQLCYGYSVSDPNGLTGLIESLVSGPAGATIDTVANRVCFTPAATGTYTFIARVVDQCQRVGLDTLVVTVCVNTPPTIAFNQGNHEHKLCTPVQLTESYSVTDANCVGGTTELLLSGPPGGGIDTSNNKVYFTPATDGTYRFIIQAIDQCLANSTDTISVTIHINQPPVIELSTDSLYVQMCQKTESTVCISYTISDPDGVKLVESLVSGTALIDTVANTICLAPTAAGKYTIIVQVADSCGAADRDTAIIFIDRILCCPSVTIEKAHDVPQGTITCVAITMQGEQFDMGGFDLLIAYDNSALALQSADYKYSPLYKPKDSGGCAWEYFTYRFGADGNCGSACPSGLIRIVAIAETNNGAVHPACWGPANKDTLELARICFLVSNDRTLECQFAPIRFFWIDCADNSFATIAGDTLIISDEVYDYGKPLPISDGTVGFPTYLGAQDVCVTSPKPGKPPTVRCIDFYNGGIDIVCADSIDARGDINLNNVAYEIADAVMFTNYFVQGLPAFGNDLRRREGSIAASDVNADGLALTVADLVYLIRVIIGDALPYAKITPVQATYTNDNGMLSVDMSMGGAYVVVKGEATPELLARNMEIACGIREGNTHVIVYPDWNKASTESFVGNFLNAHGEVLSVELATAHGAPVVAKVIPTNYELAQNHPNPFNPTTELSFSLPVASQYTLTIYNVTGQRVAEYSGRKEAGVHSISFNGDGMASGVYFYKLNAGDFSATRKMVLLK